VLLDTDQRLTLGLMLLPRIKTRQLQADSKNPTTSYKERDFMKKKLNTGLKESVLIFFYEKKT